MGPIGPYTRPTRAAHARITGNGGRNAMTATAMPNVSTAVSTVARLLATFDSTVQLSAPIRPPIDSAISTQPSWAGSLRSVKYLGNSTLSIGRYRPVTA